MNSQEELRVRTGAPDSKWGCSIEGRCINYFTRRCFKVLFILAI